MVITVVISLLIHERLFKEDAFEEEFDESFITKEPEELRFKYEIGGMPKPVRWQGWALYGIIFLSPFIVLFFVRDANIGVVTIVAILTVGLIIALSKSNYIERLKEYRKNLKNQNKR